MVTKKAAFTYSIYIQTSVKTLWNALFDPEMTKLYWGRHRNASDWEPGSCWEHQDYDDAGIVDLAGTVLEKEMYQRLVISWYFPSDEDNVDKHSKVTFELEEYPDSVQLTLLHLDLAPDGEMLQGIRSGWPIVLSSLKTLLETGRPLTGTTTRMKG